MTSSYEIVRGRRSTKRSLWYIGYFDEAVMGAIRLSFPKAHSFITCLREAMLKQASNPHLTYVLVNGITKERVPVRRWSDKEIRAHV